jgi:peptidoglycan hydrolase-like protein with peptidoglycan-binding domain
MSTTRRSFLATIATGAAFAALVTTTAPALAEPIDTAAVSTAAAAVGARPFAVGPDSVYSNIKSLQYLLNAYGIPIAADGSYGPATTKAVNKFQGSHGIPKTNYAGQATIEAMLKGSNAAVRQGWPNHNTAKAAQQQLVKLGYKTSVDGTFDAGDTKGVKAVQARYKLPATGTVDYRTWTFLFNPPTGPGHRTGAVIRIPQYGTGAWSYNSKHQKVATQASDCGPVALIVSLVRLGRKPANWTDTAHPGAAVKYARENTLRMSDPYSGTGQIGGSRGVLAGIQQRLQISNSGRGSVATATSAVRAGGVAMVVGKLAVARGWQHAKPGKGTHWVALTDYNPANRTYQVSDSSHRTNKLVWVTEAQLNTFAKGISNPGVFIK